MRSFRLTHSVPWAYYRLNSTDGKRSVLFRIHDVAHRIETHHNGKWIQEPQMCAGNVEYDFVMDLVFNQP